MEFNLDYLLNESVYTVFAVVMSLIVFDFILGVSNALKKGEFSFIELPRFLRTNVLPYALGLFIFTIITEYLGGLWTYLFYPATFAVVSRYVFKIKDKIKELFQIEINKDD